AACAFGGAENAEVSRSPNGSDCAGVALCSTGAGALCCPLKAEPRSASKASGAGIEGAGRSGEAIGCGRTPAVHELGRLGLTHRLQHRLLNVGRCTRDDVIERIALLDPGITRTVDALVVILAVEIVRIGRARHLIAGDALLIGGNVLQTHRG